MSNSLDIICTNMIDFPKFGHINNMRYGQFSYIHYQLTAPANET